ncbi:MAG TPA: hypothetical protein VM328_11565 [Fimbriimonadaceae bacterium]|nr:hypothetical protein [Fimbriimonadaceae bacterium]
MDENQASFTKGFVAGMVAAAVVVAILTATGVIGIGGKAGNHDPIIVNEPPATLTEGKEASISVKLNGTARLNERMELRVDPTGQKITLYDVAIHPTEFITFRFTPTQSGPHTLTCTNKSTGVSAMAQVVVASDQAE